MSSMIFATFRLLVSVATILHTSASPIRVSDPVASEQLVKRDIAFDICGGTGMNVAAADATRNADAWNKYNMDEWYKKLTIPYTIVDWTMPGVPEYRNVQDIVLYWAGKEGVGQCKELARPNCGASGLDFELCKKTPEAHFAYIALTNWANFLSSLQNAWLNAVASLTPLTGTLREEFFTPQAELTQLLVPVGIVSGIAGAISGFVGPWAVVAGAGALLSAVITQAGLMDIDPTEQWNDVQAAIGGAFTQVTKGIESTYITSLKSLPEAKNNPVLYYDDPTQTPFIFRGGAFAAQPEVGIFGQGIYGALAASAINALWFTYGVFLIKINDGTYGKGPGKACERFHPMAVCIDGTAYIWARWQFTAGIALEGAYTESYLEEKRWNVWGAYKQGDGNDNKLTTYDLNLRVLTDSVIKTFAINPDKPFPFTNQNGATIDQIRQDPKNLKLADLMFFSLPICDLDSAGVKLGGMHLKDPEDETGDDPIVRWAACSCTWFDDKWPVDQQLYQQPVGGYGQEDCQGRGWTK